MQAIEISCWEKKSLECVSKFFLKLKNFKLILKLLK